MVLAVAHPWMSASSYLSSQSVADSRCNPHATPRSSYSRRSPSCRFFLCRSALLYLPKRKKENGQPLSPILAATFIPPRDRPTLVVLSLGVSSAVASLSSASFCDAAAACLSLVLAAFAFRRSSALLAAYFRKKERKQTTQGRDGRTAHRQRATLAFQLRVIFFAEAFVVNRKR